AVYIQQILPLFFFGIRVEQPTLRRVVHAAEIARVPAVAAAKMLRRAFQQYHTPARATGGDRGAQRGVAAPEHQHVARARDVHRLHYFAPTAPRTEAIVSFLTREA